MDNHKQYLPTYEGCIVCGQKEKNPNTLNLRFRITDEGVETPFIADARQEGYKGIIHGGVMTSLLDETIGWAVAVQTRKYFMTAELTVRFVKSLPVGTRTIVKGRVIEIKSRYSIAGGEIVDDNGVVYARAQGKFVPMAPEQAKEVHGYLTFRDDDLDFLP